MDEYVFRSRARRIAFYIMGLLILGAVLVSGPMGIRAFHKFDDFLSNVIGSAAELRDLGEQAKTDEARALLLEESRTSEAQLENMARAMRLIRFLWLLKIAFVLTLGLTLIIWPITALRRARRRALVWQETRCGRPWYRMSLALDVPYVIFLNVISPMVLALALLYDLLDPTDRLIMLILFSIFQAAGIALLLVLVLDVARRLYFRNWRLRLDHVPVAPGERMRFEIFWESGKPIRNHSGLQLVGRRVKWNTKKDCMKSGGRLHAIPGEIQMDTALTEPPRASTGIFRIDPSGLSTQPPEDEKYPKRLLAFLRIREGRFLKCLFELPLRACYFTSSSTRKV